MRYLTWAAFYEGPTDSLYFDVLLPRLIRDIVAREGTDLVEVPDVPAAKFGRDDRSVDSVSAEACAFRDAFDVVFIHADTGGRALEERVAQRSASYCLAMQERCDWPPDQCVTITPRHETEAWILADGAAVTASLGYAGDPSEVGLPTDAQAAERLPDPKAVLVAAVGEISGRRRKHLVENIFPAIGQRQRLDVLRHSASFVQFEDRLRTCLRSLRLIE